MDFEYDTLDIMSRSGESYTALNERHTSFENALHGRQTLLDDLAQSISADERTTQYLLKAFDVPDDSIDFEPGNDDSELANDDFEPANNDDSEWHPFEHHTNENAFLSTPLRLKHFSKLSPTILRGLLRSPSIRACSDDSFSDSQELCSSFFENVARDTQDTLPLTPPPTVKIPHSTPPLEKSASFYSHHPAMQSSTVEQFRRVIDELSASSGMRRRISASPPPPQHGTGVLEAEFADLLLQRAFNEEAEAEQLMGMAKRMLKLAARRKVLARLVR